MNKKRIFKIIEESQVLTEQEKKELIKKAKIENFVNSYKIIIKSPFLIIRIIFATFTMIFATISEVFDLIEQVFHSICIKIDNIKDITFTQGEAREKILKEMTEKNIKLFKKTIDKLKTK